MSLDMGFFVGIILSAHMRSTMMHMLLLKSQEIFEADSLLFGDAPELFVLEVIFRAVVMFLVVLTSLRILGKRGVKQLSVFELVIILTLGSAAGDPMFYKDVGLLPAIMVFVMIVGLYRLVIYIADKSRWFNHLVEGTAVCLIKGGKFCVANFDNEPLGQEEFFAELRMQGVSQLGQVYRAYIETSGEISLFFYPAEEVQPGLPIFPELLNEKTDVVTTAGLYSCFYCGCTQKIEAASRIPCPDCGKNMWVASSDAKRIT